MAGIYLHIPFCKTRCIYCDFYSTTRSEMADRYVSALCRELELRKSYLDNEPVETIYFGGGTPSQLSKENFEKIFETIEREYNLGNCEEITLEANPDDLTPEYIKMLSSLPFNRISIGIQTFNEQTLRLLKRRHTAEQAISAVKECRMAGFQNISIDLMYGLPGETPESWEADLEQAVNLNVEHISAYHLIYEEGTPLYEMLQKHKVEEVDEESSVDFFALMIDRLTKAGFQHYEISNFCKPDMYSQHNSSYWTGKKYLGCGPSAHSFNGSTRQWNVSSLDKYIAGIEKGIPDFEIEELNVTTRYNDFVITSLRTMWGLSLNRLEEEFGTEFKQYCLENAQTYLDSGKLEIRDNTLFLSKEGIFISDGIMSDLLWVED
ncbi:coproporphyrinogen III oxidase, anaerobic [Bacteroides luti]|uniref:Heme chaperone HemW n=1 Tax=Bacteroides luti TaxID=1297750 RepID=A0A1M5F3E7_9BACE|nr:radical SAM family heme chaperone HemW [Bacteroides luti]SHF86063.1 coproporphyrinogen III oxidase, anaerobic [Bacteroides luti]